MVKCKLKRFKVDDTIDDENLVKLGVFCPLVALVIIFYLHAVGAVKLLPSILGFDVVDPSPVEIMASLSFLDHLFLYDCLCSLIYFDYRLIRY